MTRNMGGIDRIVRLLIVAAIVVLYVTGVINGAAAIVLGIVAVIFLLTSIVGVCPAYLPLRISTRRHLPPREKGA